MSITSFLLLADNYLWTGWLRRHERRKGLQERCAPRRCHFTTDRFIASEFAIVRPRWSPVGDAIHSGSRDVTYCNFMTCQFSSLPEMYPGTCREM